jgi:putative hydrolase of the HAD superfamily
VVKKPFSAFKVLTFDVVGTLIDFESGLKGGLAAIAGAAGKEVDGEAALAIYRDCRYMPGAEKFPDDVARCYDVIATRADLPRGDAYGRQMVEAVASAPPFADSVEALARLGRHYRLVAMTNAQRWAFDRFEAALDHPFPQGVHNRRYRYRKTRSGLLRTRPRRSR